MYPKNISSIDYKNYTLDNIEYYVYQSSNTTNHGIRIDDIKCFKNLFELFKNFGKHMIVSLETSIKNYLPTATIFGLIEFV